VPLPDHRVAEPRRSDDSSFQRVEERLWVTGEGRLVPQAGPTRTADGGAAASTSRTVFYLHARVVRGRRGAVDIASNDGDGDDGGTGAVTQRSETFLCQLDLPDAADLHLGGGEPCAQLVLGLNNHHVGSYYWARSAGGGAAMEAPGIVLEGGSVLRWKPSTSFDDAFGSNSNDGKRSEWANFLRPSDQVQLVPAPSALPKQIRYYGTRLDQVYGISSRGRPMGSEPIVACRYRVVCCARG
jgi:hypothetical protein